MKKKRFMSLLLTLAMGAVLLSGCSSSQGAETPADAPAASEEVSDTPEQAADEDAKADGQTSGEEKTLRIAYGYTITTPDPAYGGETMLKEIAGVGETLTYANTDFTIQPMLAIEWEQVEDTVWEFKLREGVTFHDGSEFNADAVKWCLERQMKENESFVGRTDISSIEVVDDYTIRISTNEPTTELPQSMCYVGTVIIAPTSVDADGNFQKAIGTGYFMQTDFDEASGTFTCEAYDGYWGDVNTSVKKRVVRSMVDASARSLALQNGEVDVVADIPFSDLEMLENSDTLQISKFNTARTYYYEYNMEKEALKDVNVRKALVYAINKEEIVNDVLLGVGEVPKGIMMAEMPWTNTEIDTYEYDPGKASEFLKTAGYEDTDGDGYLDKDGEKLSLKLLSYPGRPGCPLILQATQGYFANIGIDTSVEVVDWSAMAEQIANGDYDLALSSASASYIPSPEYYMNTTYVNSENGYQNEEVARLIEQAYATPDLNEKYELSKQAQAIAQEECGVFTVALYGAVFGLSQNVINFEYNAAAHDFIVPYGVDLKE